MGISKKSWTGVAVEATSGTAATTPTVYHPCKSKFSQKKKYVYLSEDRGSRDGNTKRKVSVRQATADLTGNFYLDTSPYLLYLFMGGMTSTQPDATNAPTGYEHDLSLVDTPKSATLFKGYDVAGYYFPYAVCAKLKYKFSADGKLLEEEASFESQYGQKISGASFSGMTPTYTDDSTAGKGTLFSGYTPTITWNGTASTNVEAIEIDLEQKITAFFAINGSQDPVKFYFGDRTAKLTLDASFDDTTLYDKFDTDQDNSLDIKFVGRTIGTGPSTVKETLQFTFPIVGLDEADFDLSKDYIQLKAKGTARPGTTLNSTFTAKVINAIQTY